MSLLIDVFVIVAFSICLGIGIKRGFIKGIVRTLVIAIAIIGAIYFTPKLSTVYNDKLIEKPVVDIARDSLNSLLSETVDIESLADKRPAAYVKVLNRFGVSPDDIVVFLAENESTNDVIVDKIASYMASPIAGAISDVAAFFTLFIALVIVLGIIGFLICLLLKNTSVKKTDRVLGGVLGFISGLAVAWGLSYCLCEILPQLSVIFDGKIPFSVVDNTVIVKFLGSFDPLTLF